MKYFLHILVINLIIILSCSTQGNKNSSSTKNIVTKNDNIVKNSNNVEVRRIFFGTYRVNVTGFMGTLIISKENNKFSGTISFDKWGYGKNQPLKDVRVNNGKIYFIRSVTTVEELKKYGSKRYFKQVFYGEYSKDGKYIKGYYQDAGAQHSWKAIKA